jgi:hypothetical protein
MKVCLHTQNMTFRLYDTKFGHTTQILISCKYPLVFYLGGLWVLPPPEEIGVFWF